MILETQTECNLEGVDDTWDTDDIEDGDEIVEVVEKARENHDEEYIVDAGSHIWMFKVAWNDKTDTVWVSRYGYNGGMEVNDSTDTDKE